MKLTELIQQGQFVVTSEVGPPKGVNISAMLEDADLLKDRVHAINVTDQQSSVMRLGSLAVSSLLKQRGIEPVFQLTCRDRNRIALQSDILSASVLGIENILCLTGDHVSLGDHQGAKPVFDMDSVSLIDSATRLRQGQDISGHDLDGAPDYGIGAVVSPCANPIEPQLYKMQRKIKAGAEFFQTQAVYDVAQFEAFMEKIRPFNVPVIAGIVMLKSVGMARFMNKNVAGISVPENLIDEMAGAHDKRTKSIEISARLIRELKDHCSGVHIMAIGWEKLVPDVLDAAGL